ncbi:hypothetical protein ACH4SK_21750 [Streptomyces inhibens]|uniref:hypothetical protein n=1 Tax=Streptomyces inhibens TaxID=2293571 RepID=UPI0037A00A4D
MTARSLAAAGRPHRLDVLIAGGGPPGRNHRDAARSARLRAERIALPAERDRTQASAAHEALGVIRENWGHLPAEGLGRARSGRNASSHRAVAGPEDDRNRGEARRDPIARERGGALTVAVRSPFADRPGPRAPGSGTGLVGMRTEAPPMARSGLWGRIALLGGAFEAGPESGPAGRVWLVRAALPAAEEEEQR